MMDVIYASMIEELSKIAADTEGSTDSESSNSDMDSNAEISPAVEKIFSEKELTRIRQAKDEKGAPSNKAHGSPVVTDKEMAQNLHDAGSKEGYSSGYSEAAREGVEQAARIGKESYDRGYQIAAKKGVEIAGQLYMKGKTEAA